VSDKLCDPDTEEQILTGKAYASALTGHFLIHGVLTDLIDCIVNSVYADDSKPR
jgi:hypothetical protein